MAPGPKEASKPSGKVVSLILATLTGTVPFMLLCCVSISHHGGHGRCVLGRFGVCLGFCIFFMLLDALLSHFATLQHSRFPDTLSRVLRHRLLECAEKL